MNKIKFCTVSQADITCNYSLFVTVRNSFLRRGIDRSGHDQRTAMNFPAAKTRNEPRANDRYLSSFEHNASPPSSSFASYLRTSSSSWPAVHARSLKSRGELRNPRIDTFSTRDTSPPHRENASAVVSHRARVKFRCSKTHEFGQYRPLSSPS